MVLLKNNNNILPINQSKKIAVIELVNIDKASVDKKNQEWNRSANGKSLDSQTQNYNEDSEEQVQSHNTNGEVPRDWTKKWRSQRWKDFDDKDNSPQKNDYGVKDTDAKVTDYYSKRWGKESAHSEWQSDYYRDKKRFTYNNDWGHSDWDDDAYNNNWYHSANDNQNQKKRTTSNSTNEEPSHKKQK